MANAKKCDRCRSYYDNNLVVKKPEIKHPVTSTKLLNENEYSEAVLDLCDKCVIELLIFLNIIKPAEEEV